MHCFPLPKKLPIVILHTYVMVSNNHNNYVLSNITGHSREIIAIATHGLFLPQATFSHRVEQAASSNAGLQLTHLLVGDSGLYSVEVTYTDDTGFQRTLVTTVHIIVAGTI